MRELGAGPDRQRDAGGVERVLHLAHARGELGERAGAQQVAHVRRRGHDAGAVRHRQPRELDGLVEVAGPVVDAGQEVEVELGPHESPSYRDTRGGRIP